MLHGLIARCMLHGLIARCMQHGLIARCMLHGLIARCMQHGHSFAVAAHVAVKWTACMHAPTAPAMARSSAWPSVTACMAICHCVHARSHQL
eukprot:208343-Chlamydomonas_euryale.AAC.3